MTEDEADDYQLAKNADAANGRFQAALRSGATSWTAAMVMRRQLAACSEAESKLQLLVRNTPLPGHCSTKNDQFAKTGSGPT
jgi:hypothetical protein